MNNKNRIILDLCGGTGSWSRLYQEAGYDVRLVTLPEYDVRTYEPPENVYGILAAPPCTEFSLAKNGSKTPKNYAAGLSVVEACLKIIWKCQMSKELQFWAMENPVGHLSKFIGRVRFTFRQWEYGDRGVKPTALWGYFNEPKKTVFEMPEGITKRYKSGKVNSFCWATPDYAKSYGGMGYTRADLRAITPPGFARAFFRANH